MAKKATGKKTTTRPTAPRKGGKRGRKMTAVDIIRVILESRGWQVQVVSQADVKGELVRVKRGGLLKCVDGRASDQAGASMHGPKMLGGVYAIASMRNVTSAAGLAKICDEVRSHNYVPSVHGDGGGTTHCGHEIPQSMGCGYFKLWKKGNLQGLDTPDFTSDEGRDAVRAVRGRYELLEGKHFESQVVINLVENMTLVPNPNDQRFIVDGWVVGKFKLDVPTYVTLAASTVEQLSGTCRSARIIVPS